MQCDADGFVARKKLPGGREAGVFLLTFGRARLTVGKEDSFEDFYDKGY